MDIKLGEQPPENAKRDAIHLAVIRMIAPCMLEPGQKLQYGIVDPFLENSVMKDEPFWLCLYQNTVTGMRHNWEHPAFGEDDTVKSVSKEESEKWLREWCETHDAPDYDTVMEIIQGTLPNGPINEYYSTRYDYDWDYIVTYGSDAHAKIPPEFWDHVKNVIGKEPKYRSGYFSCSC